MQTWHMREIFQAAPTCIIRRSDLPLTPLAEAFYDMLHRAGHNYQSQIGTQHGRP